MRSCGLVVLLPVFVSSVALADRVPEPARVVPCTIRAELQPVVRGTTVAFKVVLTNSGAKAAKVTLAAPCSAYFGVSGEPRALCPPSPCHAEPARTVTVGAKKSFPLGTVKIAGDGNTCRAPLPAGSTLFQASVTPDPAQPEVCGGAKVHIVKDAKTGALRRAKLTDPIVGPNDPPPPTPPSTTKKPLPAPRSCPPCGIGCPGSMPSTKKDANGCPSCSCEKPERPF